jgi:hypothetical protein
MLKTINAKTVKRAFWAFHGEAEAGSSEKHISEKTFRTILSLLKDKHHLIADRFCPDAGLKATNTGAGLKAMNTDAKITERIISYFTRKGIPVLTIHDSYIVPVGHELELMGQMQSAFAAVTGIENVGLKPEVGNYPIPIHDGNKLIGFDYAATTEEQRLHCDPPRSKRYQEAWFEHQRHWENGMY